MFVVLSIIFIILSALFSGFESGVISLNKVRLYHAISNNDKRAKIIASLLKNEERLMSMILLGNNICIVCTSIFFSQILEDYAEGNSAIKLLSIVIITIFLLVFGEFMPKSFFRRNPLNKTLNLAYFMAFFNFIFYPLIVALASLISLLQKFFVNSKMKEVEHNFKEDFSMMIEESKNQGLLSQQSFYLLQNSLDYYHLSVRDVMTPKEDIISVNNSVSIEEVVNLSQERKVYRILVTSDKGDFIGFVSVYDIMFYYEKIAWRYLTIDDILRKVYTILDTNKLDEALDKMTYLKQSLLLVEDDKKNPLGIITRNDVIKPLFQ